MLSIVAELIAVPFIPMMIDDGYMVCAAMDALEDLKQRVPAALLLRDWP